MTATRVEGDGTSSEADGRGRERRADTPEVPAGHRPAIDGLRAVAVYLVILFHAGTGRFTGGFIGVDVFFVLSGYLVTQVLLRDLAAGGAIRYGRFYARRARRLLPAALLALLGTAVVYSAVANPVDAAQAREDIRASLLYVANWHFIDQATGYFAEDTARSPVLHTWSLAVEEQFYLAWPLLLGGIVWLTARLGRWRWTTIRIVVALTATASAGWALHLRVTEPDRAYFGTDTRAYQLLAGALLALTPGIVHLVARHRRIPQVLAPTALLAIVLLGTDQVTAGPIWRGIAVTLATGALIVALEAARSTVTARALGVGTLVYLGQISYGTYLWHWPVIVVLEDLAEPSPGLLAAVTAVVATGIAALSHRLVEQPIRTAAPLDRHRWPVVAAGLACSVIAATVVLPRLDPSGGDRAGGTVPEAGIADFTPLPAGFDQQAVFEERYGETVDCVGRSPDRCTVVRGDGPHVLLIGDSNAQMWIGAFTEMARAEDLTLSLSVTSGCPWQQGYEHLGPEVKARCRRMKDDAYERVIPALDPDVVVAVNVDLARGPDRSTMRDDRIDRRIRDTTRSSLDVLRGDDRKVVLVEAAPRPQDGDLNPLACLAQAEIVEACRFVADIEPTWIETYQRRLAEEVDDVTSLDLDRLVCPFAPICDPVIGDTVVFWNGEHLTDRFSRSRGPALALFFTTLGLIP